MIKYLVVFLILFTNIYLFPNSTFERANELYNNGDYETASQEYLSLLENNSNSSNLLMNIASSYAMLGKKGNALLFYEKALKLERKNENIIKSLVYLRGDDNYSRDNYLIMINYIFSYSFLFFVFLSLLIFVIFIKMKKNRNTFLLFLGISLFLSILSISISFYTDNLLNKDYIIITDSYADIYEGNSKNSSVVDNTLEGKKLELIEEYGEWYYVLIDDSKKAWVSKENADKI